MIENFNSKALILARESRGLSQVDLAAKVLVPQSHLSRIEHGTLGIDKDTLEKMSEELQYPVAFFLQKLETYPPNLHYRKKASVSAKTLAKAEALMNIYRVHIQTLLSSIDLANSQIPAFSDVHTPKEAAIFLRQYWKVPKGAITDLTKLVEDNGIIVIYTSFDSDKIDGRSMTTDRWNYIIFINKDMPADRQRFTLAHELGHIVLHIYSPDNFEVDVESEANIFASEFLMPSNEIRSQVQGNKLTLAKLADLKRVWKVSMQAILHWCQDLDYVTPNQAKYLWSQFSKMGMKKSEPIEINREKPTLLNEIITAHLNTLSFSKDEMAEILKIYTKEFTDMYLPQNTHLRIERR